jgi:hypothetical protein
MALPSAPTVSISGIAHFISDSRMQMSDHTTLGRTTPDTNATTVGHLLDMMIGGLAGMMIGDMMIAATTIGVMMTVVMMTAVMMIVVIEKSGDGGSH